jgi:5-methylcytosine-specific restriction endonuclease McrA
MTAKISAARGRSTRRFRRLRQETLAGPDACIVCGHGGTDSADHVISRAMAPELAEDPDNLAPCHHEPCPTCGQRCNRLKGTRPLAEVVQLNCSRDWFAA